jgi:hypothetical protein
MSCWYFLFEGRFRSGDPTYGMKGVCSSCIVPEADYEKAKACFIQALDSQNIELIQIEDSFDIALEELDLNDPDNKPWIEWHNEAVKEDEVMFDPWQVFDVSEEDKGTLVK